MEILYLPQSTFWESKKVLNVTFLHDLKYNILIPFLTITYHALLKLDSNNNVYNNTTHFYFNFCHLYKCVSFCLMRTESL